MNVDVGVAARVDGQLVGVDVAVDVGVAARVDGRLVGVDVAVDVGASISGVEMG